LWRHCCLAWYFRGWASITCGQANALVDQVMAGSVALDPAAISAKLEAAPTPLSITISGVVFLVCWVGSILEALLVKLPVR